uniref:NRDE family protein n=1 Tax=mine drainage metagenome TaxID=410659 RepID=E6PRG4_9ZZZZ
MCLIAWSWQPGRPRTLLLAANRDEWLDRPTLPMRWWRPDAAPATEVLSGQDLRSGGIWLGLTRRGRFAAVTNVRDPALERAEAPSRGLLPLRYLLGLHPQVGSIMADCSPAAFAQAVQSSAQAYAGFNLLLGDMRSGAMRWLSNHPQQNCSVAPGLHGLSNAALDAPWPKVQALKAALAESAEVADAERPASFGVLTQALQREQIAPDAALPQTGVSLEWERALSAAFIRMPGYGTRCSTLLRLDFDGSALARELQHQPGIASPPDFVWNWRAAP